MTQASAVEEAGLRPANVRPDRAVIAIAVALLVLSGLVGWEAWRVSARAVAYGLGPTAFPAFVAGALLLLAIGTLTAGLRGTFPAREHDEIGPVLLIVAGLVTQLAVLRLAGFSIATGLLFALTALGLGRGPLWKTIPIGIVLCFLIWVAFTQLLNLSLPAGPIENAYLSGQKGIAGWIGGGPADADAPSAPAALPASPPPASGI